MKLSTSSTRALLHLTWPVLIAHLAMMANAVIDTAMAGRLSAIDLAAVGIASAIMNTVLMSLISVLLALPPSLPIFTAVACVTRSGAKFIKACGSRCCWR